MATPAGWYPDPKQDGRLRYWDGQRWTNHYQPSVPPSRTQPPFRPLPPDKAKASQRKTIIVAIGGSLAASFVLLLVLGVMLSVVDPETGTPSARPSTPSASESVKSPSARPNPKAESTATPFTITVKPRARGNHVVVDGATSLPDDALVTLLLSRNAKFEGEPPRAFPAGGDGVPVKDGKFRADIKLDERILGSAVSDSTSFGPPQAVSDTVTVCAQLRPNDDSESPQSGDVMRVIGPAGENFKSSPQRSKFGDAWRLETVTKAVLPTAVQMSDGQPVPRQRRVGDVFC